MEQESSPNTYTHKPCVGSRWRMCPFQSMISPSAPALVLWDCKDQGSMVAERVVFCLSKCLVLLDVAGITFPTYEVS